MMRHMVLSWVAALFLVCAVAVAEDVKPAEGAKPPEDAAKPAANKPAPPMRGAVRAYIYPGGPTLDDLRAKAGLTDDEIAKLKDAVTGVQKAEADLMNKEEVKAAQEESKKALDEMKKTQAAYQAALKKVDEAKGGFNRMEEFKKAVLEGCSAEKKDKVADLLNKSRPPMMRAMPPPPGAPAPAPVAPPPPAPAK